MINSHIIATLALQKSLRPLHGLRLLAVCSLLLLTSSSNAQQSDWPQWRGINSTGFFEPGADLSTKWPEDGLEPKWSVNVGPGYSGISVVGDLVFTMDRIADQVSEEEQNKNPDALLDGVERILCFDRNSGKLVWHHDYRSNYKGLDYNKGPRTTPTIHAGRLYALGAMGHLHCLDARTGTQIWARDLIKDSGAKLPTWGFAASPLVVDDKLIIHAGIPGGCYCALSLKTGKEIWRAGDDPAGYGVPIVAKSGDHRILVGWTPEHIIGMDIETGKVHWQIPYEVTYGVSIATPIFQEGHVLVCGYWHGTKSIQLDSTLTQANLAWEENMYLRGLMAQPLYKDGHAFLLDKQHGVVCFKLENGEVKWTDKNSLTPRGRNPQLNLVWIGKTNRALGLNSEGELLQVELTEEKFTELGRAKLVDFTWAHPAFSGNQVFARDDSKIICIDLPLE